jgi:crotonobetainyl-CoA:carnitine CoA-transferase CaiB-like acyl-CoA transferase
MSDTERILGDITVLELGQGIPMAYCCKLLAGLGARVIKVEPPNGTSDRDVPPFAGDVRDRERSLPFLYLNTAKQSVTLELGLTEGQQIFRSMVAEADVIVESFAPGTLANWELDYATLSSLNPALVMTSITAFGQDGPYRDYLINEIVAEAIGGLLYTMGLPEREPLKMGGDAVLHNAGGAAFSAVMAAIWQRDSTSTGQFIDVSIQEATATSQIHSSIEASWLGSDPGRRSSVLLEAEDGWVGVGVESGVSAETWPRLCHIMGRPELADDPRFATTFARRDHREELKAVVSDWVRGQKKEEVYHLLQSLRSIAGYVATTADLYRSPQLLARGFFQLIDHPVAGPASYPGFPFRVGDQPWMQFRAPLLGEHNEAIYGGELGYSRQELQRLHKEGVI